MGGMGGFGFGGGLFSMILFWVLVIAVVVLGARWIGSGGFGIGGSREKTPLQILKERYARGEINKDEFEQRRHDIGA